MLLKGRKMNKRGVSILIGYVLLVVIAISISIIVFQNLRNLVPEEKLECPNGVSVLLKEYTCDMDGKITLKLANNGRFSIGGFYVRGAADGEVIPVHNLLGKDSEGKEQPYWSPPSSKLGENSIKPGQEVSGFPNTLNFASAPGWPENKDLKKVEIVPFRFEEVEGRERFVVCGDASIIESVQDCTTTSSP